MCPWVPEAPLDCRQALLGAPGFYWLLLADEQGAPRRSLSHLRDSPRSARRTAPQGHLHVFLKGPPSRLPFPWGPSSCRNGAAWCRAPPPGVRQAFRSLTFGLSLGPRQWQHFWVSGSGPHRTVRNCVAFSFTRRYNLGHLYVSERFTFNRIRFLFPWLC